MGIGKHLGQIFRQYLWKHSQVGKKMMAVIDLVLCSRVFAANLVNREKIGVELIK